MLSTFYTLYLSAKKQETTKDFFNKKRLQNHDYNKPPVQDINREYIHINSPVNFEWPVNYHIK